MKTIASILILFCATTLLAEEVDIEAIYFHPAASHYIHGDSTSASNLVSTGLSLFPEDGKLLRLKELLDQEQEKKEQKKQEQEENKDNQEKDENKDQQQNEKKQDPEKNDPQENQQPPEDSQRPEPPSAEQMSQDEAEQLLDAMKQEEENKRLQLHPIMGAPVNVDKDW